MDHNLMIYFETLLYNLNCRVEKDVVLSLQLKKPYTATSFFY